jgi:hypothetical protein
MTLERRRAAQDRRQSLRIPATFAVKQSAGGHVQLCQAEDIGPGGITIKRPRDVSYLPRAAVALNFELPGTREEIVAEGIVTHDGSAGSFRRTGVGFIALRPEHQRAIAAFCLRAGTARRPKR